MKNIYLGFLFFLAALTVNAQTEFPTWKTVEIGQLKNSENCFSELRKKNMFAGSKLVQHTLFTEDSELLELVLLTGKDLGLDENNCNNLDTIIQKARNLGFEIIPVEAALQLRLDWTDQSKNSVVQVPVEPLEFDYKYPDREGGYHIRYTAVSLSYRKPVCGCDDGENDNKYGASGWNPAVCFHLEHTFVFKKIPKPQS